MLTERSAGVVAFVLCLAPCVSLGLGGCYEGSTRIDVDWGPGTYSALNDLPADISRDLSLSTIELDEDMTGRQLDLRGCAFYIDEFEFRWEGVDDDTIRLFPAEGEDEIVAGVVEYELIRQDSCQKAEEFSLVGYSFTALENDGDGEPEDLYKSDPIIAPVTCTDGDACCHYRWRFDVEPRCEPNGE